MPRSCDRMKRSASAGTTAAANGIALTLNVLSAMAPPINPPSAFAILKSDMLAVAASSGATLPHFMTPSASGAYWRSKLRSHQVAALGGLRNPIASRFKAFINPIAIVRSASSF